MVCLKVPRSGGSGCGCISPELEQMDLCNPSSRSPSTSGTEEDQRGSSNCSPLNCPELDRTAMVSRPHSDAGGSPTAANPAPISVVSPISANSIPSPVEVPSSDSLATIRDRYQATGLSKEVVDILLASWGTATQKWYSGPWRAWVRWCSLPRPLEDIFSSPPLYCQSTWPLAPRLRGTAHTHLFFYIVVSRPRPHGICTSIARISLRGVQRTTSPRQVSNPLGNVISERKQPLKYGNSVSIVTNSVQKATKRVFRFPQTSGTPSNH